MSVSLKFATALAFGAISLQAFAQTQTQPQPAPQPDAALQAKLTTCTPCHGPAGNTTQPEYPVLAGQNARYLYFELRDFKEGRRQHPVVDTMLASLTRDDMLALADYFSKQQQAPGEFNADSTKVAAGRKRAEELLCSMCHQGDFIGSNEIPRVAGQHYAYIKKQLADFRARHRTNDAGNMTSVTHGLSDDDIENLAQYIANLY